MTGEEMAMAMRQASQRVGMSSPEAWDEISERRRQQWRDIAHAARHLGAGQPVAADRAALVERMCTAFDEQIEYGYTAIALDFATVAMDVLDAAGWGPRAEPVAGTGETLYRKCKRCDGNGGWPGVKRERVHCDDCDGEGFVPVAPPEPLSAEEIAVMAGKVGDQEMRQWFRQGMADNDQTAIVRFVLAALPARFAVPVEGA